jgi:hypothetical protein
VDRWEAEAVVATALSADPPSPGVRADPVAETSVLPASPLTHSVFGVQTV